MRVKILGKYWTIRFVPLRVNRGEADYHHPGGKEIRVDSRLKGEERLECVIHELTHCAGWHIDEEFVEEFAEDVARVLWRLGYRNMNEE
jgi:hypothetical protein